MWEEAVATAAVTLRQFRYAVVLGEELNYRRAADRLFITQPALSTAIKQLEHQLDVVLFTRNTREVSLTTVGAAWLPTAREALRHVDAAVDQLVALAHPRTGRIRLGYLIGTGADLLFRMVRHFEAVHPEITVEATEFDFSDPTAGLGDGTVEIALLRPPVDLPRHREHVVDTEQWVACLPRDHRLADRDDIDINELLDDPIVAAPDTAGGWRDYWLAMDVRDGRAPTIAATAATYEAETTYIARGIGISFTTEACARLYERPGVVYVPITGRPSSDTALVWDPQLLTREGELFVRHVQRNWHEGEAEDPG